MPQTRPTAIAPRCAPIVASPVVALLIVLAGNLLACGRTGTSAVTPTGPPLLRVATSGDYAPFSVGVGSLPGGMDVEIADRLARDLDMRLELVHLAWPDLIAETQRDDFDIAMSGVTMRADRAIVGRYTRPYATVGAMALVRASDQRRFATIDALDQPGVSIAVNAGGHLERVARARFPRATIEPVPENRGVLPRLSDGSADAAVTDTAELRGWLRPGLRALGPFSFDFKAYLLPANHADLAQRVDDWMVAHEADGYLNSERVRWLGPNGSMDAAQVGRSVVVAFIQLRLELMPFVAAAKRAAGAPIDDPAQEQRVLERVRAASADPNRTAAVYAQLMEMAKAVQRTAPAPESAATLADLREALARIDAQLVRELDREPSGSAEIWRMTLERSIVQPGIDAASTQRLADLLVSGSG